MRRLNLKRSAFLSASLFLLLGCSKSKFTITLNTKEIEYGSISSACELVESVNGKILPNKEIDNNSFEVEGSFVECSKTDFKKLGEHIVTFTYKDIKIKETVEVVDKTAPIIHIDEGTFKVETGNEYFDVLNQISVTDNVDIKPNVFLNGTYDLKTPGTYKMVVVAKDAHDNEATQDIVVEVVEKEVVTVVEKIIVTVPDKSSVTKPSTGSGNNSHNTTPQTKPNKPEAGSTKKPANKKFLFADGYTIQTGHDACYNYIKDYSQYSRACKPLYSGDTGIGYEAVFE